MTIQETVSALEKIFSDLPPGVRVYMSLHGVPIAELPSDYERSVGTDGSIVASKESGKWPNRAEINVHAAEKATKEDSPWILPDGTPFTE